MIREVLRMGDPRLFQLSEPVERFDTPELHALIADMREVPAGKRSARFYCLLVAIGPGGEEHVFEGACEGRLLFEPRGGAGFGYDPIFVPEGFDRSYAELGDDVKNTISHRACAWARLAEWISGR